jgi:predicted nucleic acid-binding protein
MATKILDSWALMALFNGEQAADEVEKILGQAAASEKNRLLMSVVNWGEIYYSVMRGASAAKAEQIAREIATMPLEIIPADQSQARQAAIFKGTYKMSYADAFAAALAKERKAELITGDLEFKSLEKEIKIGWLS